MKNTYQVLRKNTDEVVDYFLTLRAAQSFMVKNFDSPLKLRMMRGPIFGEGFHRYEMEMTSNLKFKYSKRYR